MTNNIFSSGTTTLSTSTLVSACQIGDGDGDGDNYGDGEPSDLVKRSWSN